METFSGLRLAFSAMERGGNLPAAYNAANEKAVALFLGRKIRFLEIPEIIGSCMEQCRYVPHQGVEDILETEAGVYAYIESRW